MRAMVLMAKEEGGIKKYDEETRKISKKKRIRSKCRQIKDSKV